MPFFHPARIVKKLVAGDPGAPGSARWQALVLGRRALGKSYNPVVSHCSWDNPYGTAGDGSGVTGQSGYCYRCEACCPNTPPPPPCYLKWSSCGCPDPPQEEGGNAGGFYIACSAVPTTLVMSQIWSDGSKTCYTVSPGGATTSVLPPFSHLVSGAPGSCGPCCAQPPGCPPDCSICCGVMTVNIPARTIPASGPFDCVQHWPAIDASLMRQGCEWTGWGGPITVTYTPGHELCAFIDPDQLVYACMRVICAGTSWILTVSFTQSNLTQPCNPCIDSPCTSFPFGGCVFSAPAVTTGCPPSLPWGCISGDCDPANVSCPPPPGPFTEQGLWTPTMRSRGFGDSVSKFTHRVGIDKLATAYTSVTGKPCGCHGEQGRQGRWNRAMPYKQEGR